jgi:hypothetical protein
LRINHEAAGRGIKVNRFFLVTAAEYNYFRSIIDEIGILHAKAGVTPYVVVYERVPLHCRYGLAIWGDTYVDEVVYDIRSNSVIDNYIHWSPYKVKLFMQKIAIIRNLVEPDWSVRAQREKSFQAVLHFATTIRKQLETGANPSDIWPDKERKV